MINRSIIPQLLYLLGSLFIGYLLATGAVAFATAICRRILTAEYPNDPATVDRILLGSGYTFQGLMVFVLIPFVPLAVIVYFCLFRRSGRTDG